MIADGLLTSGLPLNGRSENSTVNREGITRPTSFRGYWDSLFPFGRRKVDALPNGRQLVQSNSIKLREPGTPKVASETTEVSPGNDFVLRLYLRDLDTQSFLFDKQGSGESPVIFDDLARERLVMSSLKRVVRLALEFQGHGLSMGELVNEGNLGLMRAAQLFDPRREVSFSHYSNVWIRMQMKRALSYQALPVSLPADFNWRRGQVLGAEERLTTALQRSPNDKELSAACGLELPAVKRIRSSTAPTFVGFDTQAPGHDTHLTLAEILPDPTAHSPVEEAIRNSDREFVETLLAELTPMQQQVLRWRFGLVDGRSRTLEEVAKQFGYVRQGIHRIETLALGKLRNHVRFQEFRSQSPLRHQSTLSEKER